MPSTSCQGSLPHVTTNKLIRLSIGEKYAQVVICSLFVYFSLLVFVVIWFLVNACPTKIESQFCMLVNLIFW